MPHWVSPLLTGVGAEAHIVLMSSSGNPDRTLEVLLNLLRDRGDESGRSGSSLRRSSSSPRSGAAGSGQQQPPQVVPDLAASSGRRRIPISLEFELERNVQYKAEQLIIEQLREGQQTSVADHKAGGRSLDDILKQDPLKIEGDEADTVYRSLQRPIDQVDGFTLNQGTHSRTAEEQREINKKIIRWLIPEGQDVLHLCTKPCGSKIMQRAVEVADRENSEKLTNQFIGHVKQVALDSNGTFVLEKCIQVLPLSSVEFILNEMAVEGVAVQAARNKFGCRVLMRLIEHFDFQGIEKIEDILIQEDKDNASANQQRLIDDPYANYVFQSLIEHHPSSRVVEEVVCNDIHTLSKMKFSSHVVSNILVAPAFSDMGLKHHDRVLNALYDKVEEFYALKHPAWGSFVFKQAEKLRAPPPRPGPTSKVQSVGSGAALIGSAPARAKSGWRGVQRARGGRKGRGRGRGHSPVGS